MIKIIYGDLTAGLNGDAVRRGSDVEVVLVRGLTHQQRKAVLRRLRQAARRGQKPPLPAGRLTFALAVDRLRAWAGNLAAIVRLHPAGSLLPSFGAAALIVLFLMTSMSARLRYDPPMPGPQAVVLQPKHDPAAIRSSGEPAQAPPVRFHTREGTSGPGTSAGPGTGTGTTLTASHPNTHKTASGSTSRTSAARSSTSTSSGASTAGQAASGLYGTAELASQDPSTTVSASPSGADTAGVAAGASVPDAGVQVTEGSALTQCQQEGEQTGSWPCIDASAEACLGL